MRAFIIALIVASPFGPNCVRDAPCFTDQQMQVTDYEAPPESLALMWDETLIVARVRVINASQRVLMTSAPRRNPRDGDRSKVVTEHRVAVLELMKAPKTVESLENLAIALPVGNYAAQGRSQSAKADELAGLVVGQEYIVFLERWPAVDAYGLAYGPAGAYRVADGSVEIPKRVAHWASFKGRDRVPRSEMDGLLSTLRTRRR